MLDLVTPVMDHFTRPRSLPTEVRVHFNLNTGGYTIDTRQPRKGWRAREVAAVSSVLRNAYFGFLPSRHRAYVESLKAPCVDKLGNPRLDANGNPKISGMRNVHAWVYGTETDETPVLPVLSEGWRPARYSVAPACFMDIETKQPLPNDRRVEVCLGSRANIDPATGLPVPSRYCSGRTPKLLPTMYWRPK